MNTYFHVRNNRLCCCHTVILTIMAVELPASAGATDAMTAPAAMWCCSATQAAQSFTALPPRGQITTLLHIHPKCGDDQPHSIFAFSLNPQQLSGLEERVKFQDSSELLQLGMRQATPPTEAWSPSPATCDNMLRPALAALRTLKDPPPAFLPSWDWVMGIVMPAELQLQTPLGPRAQNHVLLVYRNFWHVVLILDP